MGNEIERSFQDSTPSKSLFYGWWIVAAAFLNLFFSVGIIYYGFPVYYPTLIAQLGFSRAQFTQGVLLGLLLVGIITVAAVLGAAAIYAVSGFPGSTSVIEDPRCACRGNQ